MVTRTGGGGTTGPVYVLAQSVKPVSDEEVIKVQYPEYVSMKPGEHTGLIQLSNAGAATGSGKIRLTVTPAEKLRDAIKLTNGKGDVVPSGQPVTVGSTEPYTIDVSATETTTPGERVGTIRVQIDAV